MVQRLLAIVEDRFGIHIGELFLHYRHDRVHADEGEKGRAERQPADLFGLRHVADIQDDHAGAAIGQEHGVAAHFGRPVQARRRRGGGPPAPPLSPPTPPPPPPPPPPSPPTHPR